MSRTGRTISKGKHRREHSLSQQRSKCQRKNSPGRWITHPFLPLLHHEHDCETCNKYAMHINYATATSHDGFGSAAHGLVNRAIQVQAEPATLVPPTKYPLSSLPQALPAYSTSSHKGKECQASPAPICSILPYEDIHNVELVTGPSASETIQGTLFPEFMGQEYPKNTQDHGPVHLYNSVEELRTIFKASHSEEEGRAPSYRQASDIITFHNHWRKYKNLEVSKLMRATMKAWKPPVWAADKAKKKKEFLQGEEKRKRETESGVPPPPILIQALQERITSKPIQSPLGGSNTTLGTVTPIPLLARVNEQS
ncbi:hypothetical protein OG21DRAFT_1528321, partial [Imleria badia]